MSVTASQVYSLNPGSGNQTFTSSISPTHQWGPQSGSVLQQAATRAKTFRPTPFYKAICTALPMVVETTVETTYQDSFRVLGGSDAIAVFGHLKPMFNGRPQKWCEMLLRAAPSPAQSYSKTATHYYRQASSAGLFFVHPSIIGRARTRYRLTAAGMMLLDHYAAKHKKFAPFVEAYLPQKARDEINEMCCDMIMGIRPPIIRKEMEKATTAAVKHEAAKLAALQKHYMDQGMMYDPFGQLAGNHTHTFTNPSAAASMAQQMQAAQAQYSQLMAAQNLRAEMAVNNVSLLGQLGQKAKGLFGK